MNTQNTLRITSLRQLSSLIKRLLLPFENPDHPLYHNKEAVEDDSVDLFCDHIHQLTMTDTTYNGWTNRETWAIGLHLMDTVTEWIVDDRNAWNEDEVDQAAEIFQDLVAEMMDEASLATFPLLWDLLDLSQVDWDELGQAALEAAFN